MSDPSSLWRLRKTAVVRARRKLREGDPEGLHDLRVALRRASATADALGRRTLERRARKIVRSLSGNRQLEVDRDLLKRTEKLGILSPESTAALAARWESSSRGEEEAGQLADGKSLRRLLGMLRYLSAHGERNPLPRLLAKRAQTEAALAAFPEENDDEALHRHRLLVKRARYLAEDLVACGRSDFEKAASRERTVQDAIGSWNDLRLFRERLDSERRLAERRGSVRLAAELDELVRALAGAVARLRHEASDAARRVSYPVLARPRSA